MKETASEAIKGVCNLVGSKKDARVWIKIWDREGRYLLTNNVFLRQLENVPVEVIFSEMNGEKKIVYSRLGDLCGEGDTSE